MKSSVEEITAIIGTSMGGGFYAGRIVVDRQAFAIILPPKAEGEHKDAIWNKSTKIVSGAQSYCDGLSNTKAMAEAGSALAKWALGLCINGNSDFYLPSQDELEIMYRNLKPTTDKNYLYGRSGINVSAVTPTYPYTAELPVQTQAELFQTGGTEAFDPVWHWSSTQHAGYSGCAWYQDFSNGYQDDNPKNNCLRGRAIRRLPI